VTSNTAKQAGTLHHDGNLMCPGLPHLPPVTEGADCWDEALQRQGVQRGLLGCRSIRQP
jgi:hypothetical protein